MKTKLKIAFFVVLIGYIACLIFMPYVSVYITYFCIPSLSVLGLLAFGSSTNMYKTARNIAIFTAAITLLTVFSVAYVGVFLPAIFGVTFVVSLLIMFIAKEESN